MHSNWPGNLLITPGLGRWPAQSQREALKCMLKILGQIHLFLFVVLETKRIWGLELLTSAYCQVKPETEPILAEEREKWPETNPYSILESWIQPYLKLDNTRTFGPLWLNISLLLKSVWVEFSVTCLWKNSNQYHYLLPYLSNSKICSPTFNLWCWECILQSMAASWWSHHCLQIWDIEHSCSCCLWIRYTVGTACTKFCAI